MCSTPPASWQTLLRPATKITTVLVSIVVLLVRETNLTELGLIDEEGIIGESHRLCMCASSSTLTRVIENTKVYFVHCHLEESRLKAAG